MFRTCWFYFTYPSCKEPTENWEAHSIKTCKVTGQNLCLSHSKQTGWIWPVVQGSNSSRLPVGARDDIRCDAQLSFKNGCLPKPGGNKMKTSFSLREAIDATLCSG